MYIDIDENITGMQDGRSLVIIAKNVHFSTMWPIYEKLVNNFGPCFSVPRP